MNFIKKFIATIFLLSAMYIFFGGIYLGIKDIDYLEYECVEGGNLWYGAKANGKIFKEHIVWQTLHNDGREVINAFECKVKEDSDYYNLRYCGHEIVTIDKRDNSYTSRNKNFAPHETWATQKGYCKKKNIFTRLFFSFDRFKREEGFEVDTRDYSTDY